MELFPLLLIAFVCVAVGVAVGVLVTSLISSKTPATPAPDPVLEQAAGLWRERQTGSLLVEMDGLKFHSVYDMNDGQRQRLVKAVRDLRAWSGVPEKPRGEEAAATPVWAEIATFVSERELRSNLPQHLVASGVPAAELAEEEQFLDKQPAQPVAETFKRPSLNPVEVIARALRADVPKPGSPPLSIAGQIDEILQAELGNLHHLKGRAIRLMELPGKGMVVMVGLDQYDSLKAVPDPEIRSLLQACVEEWEARHT
jgi:hypothetical protein